MCTIRNIKKSSMQKKNHLWWKHGNSEKIRNTGKGKYVDEYKLISILKKIVSIFYSLKNRCENKINVKNNALQKEAIKLKYSSNDKEVVKIIVCFDQNKSTLHCNL